MWPRSGTRVPRPETRAARRRGRRTLIGYALLVTNPRLRLKCVGSPREVLDAIRSRHLDPTDAIAAPDTEIQAAEVFKEEPELAFEGGPHAQAIIELLEAIRKCDPDGVASVLRAAPDPLSLARSGPSVLLTAAVAFGNAEILELLLARGANPSGTTQFGMTPLHWAAALGNTTATVNLLRAGADVSRLSWFYVTAYELANINGRLTTERAIAERLDGPTTPYSLERMIARMSQ
jgi:hypothetical protein